MSEAHVNKSSSHGLRVCTIKRMFFDFCPDEDNDYQQDRELFFDYAARICEKYGFLAFEESKSETSTYWSE
jgi:hypothetical protein